MLDPGVIALMIPIVVLMIPIVAILTAHQQKMAQLIHGSRQQPNPEIDALRREVQSLKEIVHQQTLAIDDRLAGLPKHSDLPAEREVQA